MMNGVGTSTTSAGGGWGGQDTQMVAAGDDDFQQFLDMGGMGGISDTLQFDFGAEFQGSNGSGTMMETVGQRDTHLDTSMTGTGVGTNSMKTTMSMPPVSAAHMVSPVDPIMNIDAEIQMLQNQKLQLQEQQRERQRQQLQLQQQQQARHSHQQAQQHQQDQRRLEEQQTMFFNQQNRIVPPTPQSTELHNSASQLYRTDQGPSAQQAVYDQFHRLREAQDLSFTPLVSPAVTPLETHFQPENQFTVNPACFSPISSPALHAQNDNTMPYDHRMAGLSVNSPVDVVMQPSPNLAGNPPPAPENTNKRKARNPAVAPKSRAKSVRQSPITKAQKKRTTSTPNIAKHIIDEIVENASKGPTSSTGMLPGPAQTAVSTDTSEEDGSVSPENITEMPPPPPPQPRSAKQSPYMQPQNKGAAPQGPSSSRFSPATPASLMKLPSPSVDDSNVVANGSDVVSPEGIDNLELPESVTSKSKSATTSLPSQQSSPEQTTPKGPVPPLIPSPIFVKPTGTVSASQSPQIAPSANRKTPQLAPRNSKKRSSASVQSSPALRPRISPSIKPLLPGGAGLSAEDTASHLLATKSNYQNILEGNKVPGITYSSDVLTNLTSKRTSHKIAEQGRRNRINTALQEIATLLPQEEKPVNSEKKDGKQGSLPNSKASTVEMAIEYIKELKKQVESERERADAAEKKLHELGNTS